MEVSRLPEATDMNSITKPPIRLQLPQTLSSEDEARPVQERHKERDGKHEPIEQHLVRPLSALGVFFGGWIASHLDWRSAFLIVGLVSLVLAVRLAGRRVTPAALRAETRRDAAG